MRTSPRGSYKWLHHPATSQVVKSRMGIKIRTTPKKKVRAVIEKSDFALLPSVGPLAPRSDSPTRVSELWAEIKKLDFAHLTRWPAAVGPWRTSYRTQAEIKKLDFAWLGILFPGFGLLTSFAGRNGDGVLWGVCEFSAS